MTVAQPGLLQCARYSFAPNQLHYCGPERQRDLKAYLEMQQGDRGLSDILNQFDTLYKYLSLIAYENDIHDPFDQRVVEAYWLGNSLLTKAKYRPFAEQLDDQLELKKKLPPARRTSLLNKLDMAVPHHTFHVLNVFRRTGHHAIPHTLETMDSCRISWGKLVHSRTAELLVEVETLVYEREKLKLGKPIIKKVSGVGFTPEVGDWVSMHWGVVCEVIDEVKRRNLEFYTKLAIDLANRGQ